MIPSDVRDPIRPGEAVIFPQDGLARGDIKRGSETEFALPADGVFEVRFVVAIEQAGQLVIALDAGKGPEELSQTVVGREGGGSQVVGVALVATSEAATLSVRNPRSAVAPITVTGNAGGSDAVSAHLVILRLR